MTKFDFYSFTRADLESFFKGSGKESFRATQLFKWVYERGVTDIEKMSNLSKAFREEMKSQFTFELPKIISHLKSTDGTQKFLFEVEKGMSVEAVMIPAQEDRRTLCLSSEVGCNMACQFCYTGKQKLKRRLTAGEIVGQFLQVVRNIGEERVTNIVFMGMGEPLDNPDEVFKAIAILKDDHGINFSRKKITVSTSGLVPLIPRVTEAGVRLAVSLNASNDKTRDVIMPINKKYPIAALLQASLEHAHEANDRVTFEYVMLKDVNDNIENAKELVHLLRSIPCKVNLIPFNEHPGTDFVRPHRDKIYAFQNYLMSRNFHTTVRKTMGRDIYAACGQLTSLYKDRPESQNVETGVLG